MNVRMYIRLLVFGGLCFVLAGCVSIPIFTNPLNNADRHQFLELAGTDWVKVDDGEKTDEPFLPAGKLSFVKGSDGTLLTILVKSSMRDGKIRRDIQKMKTILAKAGKHTYLFWQPVLESEKNDDDYEELFSKGYLVVRYRIDGDMLGMVPLVDGKMLKNLISSGELTGVAPEEGADSQSILVTAPDEELEKFLATIELSVFSGKEISEIPLTFRRKGIR